MGASLFEQDLPRAELSEDGRYRYVLRRRWGQGGKPVLFVALNPSTADAELDDPTVTRMIGFATVWGHPAMELVNLYALRSTDPRALIDAEDPCGPENDDYLRRAIAAARFAVVCWGHPAFTAFRRRGKRVYRQLVDAGLEVTCLRVTQQGHPEHPLYLPGTLNPVPWEPPRG